MNSINFKKILFQTALVAMLIFGQQLIAAEKEKTGSTTQDAIITTKVKSKILATPEISVLDIKVETQNGIVKLSGEVKSEKEFYTAIEVANSVSDVVDVDESNLKIKSAQKNALHDSIITAKIKGLFLREKMLGNGPIDFTGVHVETKSGIVYLTGKVDNEKVVDTAVKLSKTVKGVKNVQSSISIEKQS